MRFSLLLFVTSLVSNVEYVASPDETAAPVSSKVANPRSPRIAMNA